MKKTSRLLQVFVWDTKREIIINITGQSQSTVIVFDRNNYLVLNEKDLKSFSGSSVRKCFSVVPQSNDFFSGTILDSFKEVNPHIDENSIFKVLDEVELTDFVKNLPLGIHQFLGNNGLLLSGGQARRLVLARALCRNCDLLILD